MPGLSGEVTADQAAPPHAKIADGTTSTALFRPGTCQPILIEPESTSASNEVAEVNPQTGRTGKTWQLPYGGFNGSPSPGQDEFLWGPERSNVLAYIDDMQLSVVDLDSGTAMVPDSEPWNNAALIIGWSD